MVKKKQVSKMTPRFLTRIQMTVSDTAMGKKAEVGIEVLKALGWVI